MKATSVALSALAGGVLGTLGGAIGAGFMSEGMLIEHSQGLSPFGESTTPIREWLAPIMRQTDDAFNRKLDAAIETIDAMLNDLLNDHHDPLAELRARNERR